MWLSGCVCDVLGRGVLAMGEAYVKPFSAVSEPSITTVNIKNKCPSVSLGAAEQFVLGPCSDLVGIVWFFLSMSSVVGARGMPLSQSVMRKTEPREITVLAT